MTPEALWTLAAWLSPSFPVGAYSYSHGLEWAVEAGDVTDRESLTAFVRDVLEHGAGRTDAILFAAQHRAPDDPAPEELARALQPSRERLLETEAQGAAFTGITAEIWRTDPRPVPYPIAVSRAAASQNLPLEDSLLLYLHAFAANLVSAGLRLVPLGQTDGQRALRALSEPARRVMAEAVAATLDDIGGAAIRADIAAMRHETQYTRLFRS